MQCKQCEYSLWNLRGRTCPECGTGFRPSDFEFTVNSVAFRCPHCDQDYYGTDERGHLEPRVFTCVRCQRTVDMDEMVLFPTAGVNEAQTRVQTMPWLNREGLGVMSWLRTVGWAIAKPSQLMRAAPAESGLGSALLFALVTIAVFACIAMLPFAAILLIGGGGLWSIPAMFAGLAMASLIVMLIYIVVAHLVLVVTGGTAHGLSRTVQAVSYSIGTNIGQLIPCIGGYLVWVGWIWWAISAGIMLRAGQQVQSWRAGLAAGIAGLVPLAIVAALVFWSVSAIMNVRMTMANWEAQTLSTALAQYQNANNGSLPPHAVYLILDSSADFLDFDRGMNDPVLVGETTLQAMGMMNLQQQTELAQELVELLPDGVIAHRLGEFVFTWHDIAPASADDELWVFVQWPEHAGGAPANIVVVSLAGNVQRIASREIRESVTAQNELREAAGLAPLPTDLSQVTHDKPAVKAK